MMKHAILAGASFLLFQFMLSGCDNAASEAAGKQAGAIDHTIQSTRPGEIATSPTGNFMTCKVNGKDWSASSRMPDFDDRSSYFLLNFKDGEDFISYSFWKQGMKPGESEVLKGGKAVQLHLDNEFLSAEEGEITISSVDEHWVEGSFHFVARKPADGSYKLDVTDGRFRASRDAATK